MIECEAYDLGMCSVERDQIRAWREEHGQACSLPRPAIGSGGMTVDARYVIILRPTSIGPDIKVRCDCGAEQSIGHPEHL